MTATKKIDERQFDLRVVERRLSHGQLDAKDYEAYLKGLPNDESKADWVEVYEEPLPEELTPCADEPTFTSA